MSSSPIPLSQPPSMEAAALLGEAREARVREFAAAGEQLRLAAEWADLNPPESVQTVTGSVAELYGDSVLFLAGEGAPGVAEFCVAQLAAVLQMSTDSGRAVVGDALELRHRLPRLWQLTMEGRLPPWRARQVARKTRHLSAEAAAFVDAYLAAVAAKVSAAVIDRLVIEAISRFMPETAEEAAKEAKDRRGVVIDLEPGPLAGTATVFGEIDLPDALDLEASLSIGAARIAALGSTESLEARRALALGSSHAPTSPWTCPSRQRLRRSKQRKTPFPARSRRREAGGSGPSGRWCCTCTFTRRR